MEVRNYKIFCKACDKQINGDDRFILLGKYPAGIKLFWRMLEMNNLESWGDIYHKDCYSDDINKA